MDKKTIQSTIDTDTLTTFQTVHPTGTAEEYQKFIEEQTQENQQPFITPYAFNPEKMYTYLKGFFSGAKMTQSLKALQYAREKHSGQTRKNGLPISYIHCP